MSAETVKLVAAIWIESVECVLLWLLRDANEIGRQVFSSREMKNAQLSHRVKTKQNKIVGIS